MGLTVRTDVSWYATETLNTGEPKTNDSGNDAGGFAPSTNAMTAHGLPSEKAATLGSLALNNGPDDGVSQTSTSPPTSVLVTLAAAGRNPTDILIPTQAGTDGSGGDDDDDDVAGGGSASGGMSFQATADGGDGKSHEESADQGWVSWMIGGVAAGLRKADQAGGAAMSLLMTGSAQTGESGSFVGMAVQWNLGIAQGAANTVNGVQDAVIGLANLAAKGVNTVSGHTAVREFGSPDWARDLAVYESDTTHNASKFLGGNGVITLLTAGAGAAGAAGSGAKVLQVTVLVAQADGTVIAVSAVVTVTPAAVAGSVGAIGALFGSIEQTAHMSVAGGPPTGGGPAPKNAKGILDQLPGKTGKTGPIKEVPNEQALKDLFDTLSKEGKTVNPGTYPGVVKELPDGTIVRMRPGSTSGGATLDITMPDGKIYKVHIP